MNSHSEKFVFSLFLPFWSTHFQLCTINSTNSQFVSCLMALNDDDAMAQKATIPIECKMAQPFFHSSLFGGNLRLMDLCMSLCRSFKATTLSKAIRRKRWNRIKVTYTMHNIQYSVFICKFQVLHDANKFCYAIVNVFIMNVECAFHSFRWI